VSIICLDYLVGLKDSHFEEMEIADKHHDEPELCPFGPDTLETMLQNSTRRISFHHMIFKPDHCRTFASSGTKTSIQFYFCQFQDGEADFMEASATRQDESSCPASCVLRDATLSTTETGLCF
jgi:hypothetical protein